MNKEFNRESILKLVLGTFSKFTSKELSPDDIVFNIGIDSLDLVQLITEVEEKYKIEISDSELVQIQKISDLVQILVEKTKNKEKE